MEDSLLAQIAEATRGPGVTPRGRGESGDGPWGGPGNNLGTGTHGPLYFRPVQAHSIALRSDHPQQSIQ